MPCYPCKSIICKLKTSGDSSLYNKFQKANLSANTLQSKFLFSLQQFSASAKAILSLKDILYFVLFSHPLEMLFSSSHFCHSNPSNLSFLWESDLPFLAELSRQSLYSPHGDFHILYFITDFILY